MTYLIIAFFVFVMTLFVWQRFFEEDTNPDGVDITLKITMTMLASSIWPVSVPAICIFLVGRLVIVLATRK